MSHNIMRTCMRCEKALQLINPGSPAFAFYEQHKDALSANKDVDYQIQNSKYSLDCVCILEAGKHSAPPSLYKKLLGELGYQPGEMEFIIINSVLGKSGKGFYCSQACFNYPIPKQRNGFLLTSHSSSYVYSLEDLSVDTVGYVTRQKQKKSQEVLYAVPHAQQAPKGYIPSPNGIYADPKRPTPEREDITQLQQQLQHSKIGPYNHF
jgi:hypothetical protein